MNSNCATTIVASQLIVEPYQVTESRIKQVIDILSDRGDDNLNLAAAAREFRVPVKRLRARWAGQQSKQERPGTNKRLSEDEELAVCLYLDRIEAIGTAARKQMITGCANDILRHYHGEAVEKRPEPAALISTKSNSCTHFVLSESRLSKKTPSSLHSKKLGCCPSPPKSFLSNYRHVQQL